MTADTPSPTTGAQLSCAEGPNERLAQLAGAFTLVARLAGNGDPTLPAPSNLDADYAAAGPITRRRFDALAAETAAFSAAGIEVLLRQRSARGGDCRAAAARLAAEMRGAITTILQVIERRA